MLCVEVLNRAVLAPPIWRFPVGLGANLVLIIEIPPI